jgi:nucleoside-diphosphate-sugar epimerase
MAKEKRVIITGNKGYISRNLEKYLTKNGYVVGGFDIKDGVDASTFSLPKKHGITAIIHLAAIASVNECEKNIEAAVKNNIIASSNIFQLSIENDIQIIFASSQAAKSYDHSTYGATKKYAECYAKFFNTVGGKIRILRLCNVYGGDGYLEEKDSVVARFIRAKKESRQAVIHGDGSQTRDFVHIDDVCEAIYLSLYNTRDMDEIIDVGTGKETSILELANILGCDITLDANFSDTGVTRNVANLKYASEILGYHPKKSLEEFATRLNFDAT